MNCKQHRNTPPMPVEQHRPCNLCGQSFRMASKFSRFCNICKNQSTTYKLAESMPEPWLYDVGDMNEEEGNDE